MRRAPTRLNGFHSISFSCEKRPGNTSNELLPKLPIVSIQLVSLARRDTKTKNPSSVQDFFVSIQLVSLARRDNSSILKRDSKIKVSIQLVSLARRDSYLYNGKEWLGVFPFN